MLKNIWNRISVYCLNHDEPKLMGIISNTEYIKTPFYACEDYVPEIGSGKIPCPNRLNTDDYQKVIMQFLSYMEENPFSDYLNYSFHAKGTHQRIFAKVIKYTNSEIWIGIKNNTVLGG